MTKNIIAKTKYTIKYTNDFKKDYKKIVKQGKDISKLKYVINELNIKYKDHLLRCSKHYKNCSECHINKKELILQGF